MKIPVFIASLALISSCAAGKSRKYPEYPPDNPGLAYMSRAEVRTRYPHITRLWAAAYPEHGRDWAQTNTAGLVVEDDDEGNAQDEDRENGIAFIGPDFHGGPNITDYGTAKTVYDQIMKRNPNYNPWNNPEYAQEMADLGITEEDHKANLDSLLGKRTTGKPPSFYPIYPHVKHGPFSFDCGIGTHIDPFDSSCQEGIMHLHRLGDQWCDVSTMQRKEVSCAWKCGIFLGTTSQKHAYVRCGKIANDAMLIAHRCGPKNHRGSRWAARGRIIYKDYYVDLTKEKC